MAGKPVGRETLQNCVSCIICRPRKIIETMLRLATLLDLEHVASWVTSARDCELWAGWRVSFPVDVSSLPNVLEFATSKAFSLFNETNELVAFGQLVPKNAGRGHLARLIVKPPLRGKGYGKAVVRGLIERAREDGFECISLNVDAANAAAVSLYLKVGFVDAVRPVDEPNAPGARYMEMLS
jgi:ribosomal protein S18 acetylase RimI-like enzyme